MPDVRLNSLKNRLYITIGDWDQADMRPYVRKIESACKALVPGFSCLVVLIKKGLIRQKEKDLVFSTKDLISAYGASKVVCVVKTSGYSSMSRLNPFTIQPVVAVEHALSTREAEDILDNKAPSLLYSSRS